MKNRIVHPLLKLIFSGMLFMHQAGAFAENNNIDSTTAPSDSVRSVSYNGSLSLSNVLYHTTTDTGYRSPFSYTLSGQFNLSWKSFTLPFSFVYSEQERSFTQPFNQLGASPSYKWVTVHAGYRNLTFSPYTLAGHTFLGGGLELTPGKLRFGAIYGRFVKAVSPDSVLILPGESTYDRYALAFKLGLGSSTNFVDLIYLKGWDVPSTVPDLSDTASIRPAVNNVLGLTIQQKMGKHFQLKINSAASVYTNDIYAEPITTKDKNLQKIIDGVSLNGSTQIHYAVDGSLAYAAPVFGMGIAYKRISPDYKSMGMYFVTNDIEQYTATPSLNLWKKKVRLAGSIGLEHDNLAENRSFRTNRVIGSANLNFNPVNAFGLTASFYNYSLGQVAGIRQLNDTIRLAQINKGITITPRLMLGKKDYRHIFIATLDARKLDDQNVYTENFTEYTTTTEFVSYSITQIKSALTASVSANSNTVKSNIINTAYRGFALNISKGFFDYKLSTGVTAGYNKISNNGEAAGSLINTGANFNYTLHKYHRFSLNLYNNNFKSTVVTTPSYTDYTIRITYQYTLAKKYIL